MRSLIAIASCHKDRRYQQQQRDTWLRGCPIDYRFFLGESKIVPSPDEVFLYVGDRSGIPFTEKVKAIIQWAFEREYDYLFRCDVDTYVHVPRLLSSGFESYDYVGNVGADISDGPAYGGTGYWLSRKSMSILLHCEVDCRCDDYWVNFKLREAGIYCHHDPRYSDGIIGPAPNNDIITLHEGDYILPETVKDRRLRAIPAVHARWI